jgi:hypothetical protein
MLHACVQRFDVTDTVQIFWAFSPTKQTLDKRNWQTAARADLVVH